MGTQLQKKISIITVVFNGEKYIEDAIYSVISQKSKEIEYIIIDGKSSDSTLTIAKKYAKDIDIIISEPDKGLYDAMNKGWKIASGEYIAFLNSDDFYLPDMLESVLECTNEKPNVIVANTLTQDRDGARVKFKRSENKSEYKLHLRLPFMHPSVFIKKEIIAHFNGFNLKYKVAADCELLLKIINKNPTIKYTESHVVMRLGGISNTHYKLGRKEYKEIYLHNFGHKFKAWYGYIESILFFYLSRVIRVFK